MQQLTGAVAEDLGSHVEWRSKHTLCKRTLRKMTSKSKICDLVTVPGRDEKFGREDGYASNSC